MVVSRKRPKGAHVGAFGLSVLALSLLPTSIGYQDLAALLIRQQDVSQRARAYALASPFGTIHAATFSFPRPVGTLIPERPAYRLISLGCGDDDITGSLLPGLPSGVGAERLEFPVVNRRLKGDLLIPKEPLLEPEPEGTRDLSPGRVKTVSFPRPPQNPHLVEDPPPREEEAEAEPAPADEGAAPPTEQPVPTRQQTPEADSEPSVATAPQNFAVASLPPVEVTLAPKQDVEPLDPIDDANPEVRLGRLYFGSVPVGKNIGPIERWPGEEPLLVNPLPVDPDIKRTALAPLPKGEEAGETIAPKGEVTGPEQRPKTP